MCTRQLLHASVDFCTLTHQQSCAAFVNYRALLSSFLRSCKIKLTLLRFQQPRRNTIQCNAMQRCRQLLCARRSYNAFSPTVAVINSHALSTTRTINSFAQTTPIVDSFTQLFKQYVYNMKTILILCQTIRIRYTLNISTKLLMTKSVFLSYQKKGFQNPSEISKKFSRGI